jgi:putative DNA primase/helicase
MTAAEIAVALGDTRREGRRWRCRCLSCGGRNLTLEDGASALLVWCWNNCDSRDVLAELRRRRLLDGRADHVPHIISAPRRADHTSRTASALGIWREARDGADTIARHYLANRRIELDSWPPSLRFHPRCPRPRDDAGNLLPPLPAMVALVEHVELGPVAVHCSYLQPDGGGKAELPKNEQRASFGPVKSAAVRFGAPRPGELHVVGEGIESTLSAAMPCGLSAWAALSAGGIKNLMLPRDATHVVICADNDASGTGERAAHDAATRWLSEGRRVRIAIPPEPGTDFNNILTNRVAAKSKEACHVAA